MNLKTRARTRLDRRDLLPIVFFSLACFALIGMVTSAFGTAIIDRSIGGRWFQSDAWRVYDDMVDWGASHYRNHLRPLFSLIAIPVVTLIEAVLPVRSIEAIWIFNAVCMSAWTGGLYLVARIIGASVVSASLVASLAVVSASAMFWFTVPETYGLSALCLVVLLLVAAIEVRRPQTNRVWIAAGALVTCTLVSNILVVLALAFAMKSRKDALRISIAAVLIFLAAVLAQRVIFPVGATIRLAKMAGETQLIFHPDSGGPACIAVAEFISPIVAPAAAPVGEPEPSGRRMSLQCAHRDPGNALYPIAAILWLGMLGAGVATLVMHNGPGRRLRNFGLGVAGALSANSALHLLYGEETFLYALHFSTLMLVLASGIFLSRRRWALPLAITVVCPRRHPRSRAGVRPERVAY